MKLKLIILLTAISFALLNPTYSQEWKTLLPQAKIQNGNLNFYDVQKAFNSYWGPRNVVNGYYKSAGADVKAGGWKQFKRWEWLMETRINPTTGAFPTTTGIQEFQKTYGFFKAASATGDWTSLGPSTSDGGYAGLGRFNCIAFREGDNDTYYAGSASGGLWKTTDDGLSWTVLTDQNKVLGVSDVIVVPGATTDTDIIYIGTGDRDGGSMWSLNGGQWNDNNSIGIRKSIDGGSSWQPAGLSFATSQKVTVNRMLIDPFDSNILYAATSLGLYKTLNAGTSWNLETSQAFIDLVMNPDFNNIIYGSTLNGEMYKSNDSGENWTVTLSGVGSRIELAVSPDNANIVYALVSNGDGFEAIYKSSQSGINFAKIFWGVNMMGWTCDGSDPAGDGQASYDLCIAADPNDVNTVFIGGVNTWKSTDGGVSWSINTHWSETCGGTATTVHADKHYLEFQNGTSTLFECNDGGVYRTTDSGNSWEDLTNGIVCSQLYRLGVAQTSATDIIIGLQDNGTKSLNAASWSDVIGGDGMECLIDYTDDNVQYGELYFGEIRRTDNKWGTWTGITSSITENGSWVTPFIIDQNDNNTLYAGYNNVWKTTNKGDTWTNISSINQSIRSLAIAPSNSNTIYAASTNNIYSTIDGGTNWNTITNSLPTVVGSITYIAVKNDDPNTLWVTIGGYNLHGVYQSTDGGSNWVNISSGLPHIPIMSIVQNRQNTEKIELYVGTDVGIYMKMGDNNWIPFMANLPNVVVTELDIYYDDVSPQNTRIRAATYGRGLWESETFPSELVLGAAFSASPLTGIAPITVEFTDESNGVITSRLWDFGDGETSTEENPSHTYLTPGSYTVSLSLTDAGGSDTETKANYVDVIHPAPNTDFEASTIAGDIPLEVIFTDRTTGEIDTWDWDFGDGNTSTQQSPTHTYVLAGTYTVQLITTKGSLSDTLTRPAFISTTNPPIYAGFDGSTCGQTAFTVSGAQAMGSVSISWTTSGDGTFDAGETTLTPTYTPGVNDVIAGTVTLSMSAIMDDSSTETDVLILTVHTNPDVNAGTNLTICENSSANLNGTANNYSTIEWATSGDGSFSDAASLTSIYYPGANDILSGDVDLTLTAYANTPCNINASSILNISFAPLPTVNAGVNITSCSQSDVQLNATASDYNPSTIIWSGGGGSFNSTSILNPIYIPTVNEVIAGSVTLTLTVSSQSPCFTVMSDDIAITLYDATIDAGGDVNGCNGESVTIQNATARDVTIVWSSSGTGIFDDNTSTNPTYTPSAFDYLNPPITLTMTATAEAPCTSTIIDEMRILSFVDPPTVTAGFDATICQTETYETNFASTNGEESSLQWSSDGNGTFGGNSNSLRATYTPGSVDIARGFANLTLTAYPNSPCANPISHSFTLTIQQSPLISAGDDESVCEGGFIELTSASALYYNTLTWISSGGGTFSDPSVENPTYFPTAADIISGVVLTMTATSNSPCVGSFTDAMALTGVQDPSAYAGADAYICETESYFIDDATATNYFSVVWTTSGDGLFSNFNALRPTYTPGPLDISNGSVILELTANAISPCATSITDALTIEFSGAPVIDAGTDVTICAGTVHTTNASVSNHSSFEWLTSGDGSFANITSVNNIYTPGPLDINNGTVILSLTATGLTPCSGDRSDSFTITIHKEPTVYAGPDEIICETPFTLMSALVDDYVSVLWTTLGSSGTLTNPNTLTPTYTASAQDISAGFVILNLTANPISPCASVQSDQIRLEIKELANVNAGADVSICMDETYTVAGASVINHSSYQWTSTGTGNLINSINNLSPTYIPSANDIALGSVKLILTAVSMAPCTLSIIDDMVITFEPLPTVEAGPNTTICETGDFLAVNASVQNYASIEWSTSGTGSFDLINVVNARYYPSPNDILNGSVRLTLTAESNNPCSTTVTDFVDININNLPIADAGPNAPDLCSGDSFTVTQASVSNYSSINWITSGSGQIINPNTLNPTYIPSAADAILGTIAFTLEVVGLPPCNVTASDAILINVIPGMEIYAGANASVCENSVYTVTDAEATNYSSINWTTTGTGVITNANSLTPTYSPSALDIIIGTVTLSLNAIPLAPCTDVQFDNLLLSVYSEPTVDAGSDHTICEGTTFTLNDATAEDYSSILWITSGSGSFSNENILNPTYIPTNADISSGSVILTLTATGNAACSMSPSDNMTLNLLPAPTIDAGSDAMICENSSYTINNAIGSNYTNLNWTHNGAGVLTNSGTLSPTYTPGIADAISGSVILTVTATGDLLCNVPTDQMILTIVKTPIVNVGADQITCEGDDYSIIHANAENYSALSWATSGNGTFNNASIINPIYTPHANDLTAGVVLLTLTATPDLPCSGAVSDNFALQFEDLPTANAGANASICQGNDYTVSGASASNYASITWTSSGSGSFINENTFTPTYTPSATDILLGSITLSMNAFGNAPCSNISDNMTLTITEMPIVEAGLDAQICEGSNFGVVTASTVNTSNIFWSTSGTGAFTAGNSISPIYTPSSVDITAGSVILTLTATADAPCVGQVSDFITLTIVNEPTAIAGPDATICAGDSYSIENSSATDYSSLLWATTGWGTFINNGTLSPTYFPSSSDISSGLVVLTLTANSITPCANDASDALILYFNDGPLVDAGISTAICEDGLYINTDANASNTTSVSWATSGTGSFTNPNIINTSYIPSAVDIANGAVTLTITGTGNAPCTTDVDNVTITINKKPIADAGTTTDICMGPNIIQGATAEEYSSVLWTTTGTGILNNTATLSPTYSPSAGDILVGTVTFTLTAQPLASCALAASSSIIVNVNESPIADAGIDDIICEGSSYTLTGASASNFSGLNWSTSGTGSFTDPSVISPSYTPSFDDILTASITLTLTASNTSCSDVSDYMILNIQSMPSVYAGKDSAVCEAGNYAVQDALITNYTSILWTHNGLGNLASATTLSPIYSPGIGDIAAGTVTLSVAVTASAPCFGIINDALILEIKHEPTAFAGRDTTICETENFMVVGALATDYHTVDWSTSGTGTFISSGTITPTYIPSQADINAGNVTLRIHVSNPPCENITDEMTISFSILPQLDAGFDASVNFGSSFQVSTASASNHNGINWSTNGTGTFVNTTGITPTYTPSAQDFAIGQIELRLNGIGVVPCGDHSDFMLLTVTNEPDIEFYWDQDCVGSTTQFSIDQTVTDVNTIVSWNWDFGDGATSVQMEPSHLFNVPGSYDVTLRVVDIDNYSSTISHTITINPLPIVNFDIDAPSCSNLSTQFHDYSSTPDGYITEWHYNFGDGNNQSITFPENPNITHEYAIAGVYHVILTATNSLGCSNSISRPITVVPSPIANFDMNAVCVTGGASFEDLSQANGGSNIVDWTWDFGDPNSGLNNMSNTVNPTHIYSVDGNYDVSLSITNTNGCTSTLTRTFAVSIQPDVDFTYSGNSCLNNETQFVLVSDILNINNINFIEWNFGDGTPVSTDLSPTHVFTSTGVFMVTLYINNNGCESIITKLVTINPSPLSNFTFENTCMNNSTVFTDLSVNASAPIVNWDWDFGVITRTDDSSALRNPNYTYTESGSYTSSLIVTDANGCSNQSQQNIDILPSPRSAFSYQVNIDNTQGKVLMVNESTGATEYFWDFGDGSSDYIENPDHEYTVDGNYTIELISWNQQNCTDTATHIYQLLFKGLFIPNAFAPSAPQEEVRIFKAVGINLRSFKIEVFDSWGNLVWESTALDEFGSPSESWDGIFRNEEAPVGIYVWKASGVFLDGSIWKGEDVVSYDSGTGKTFGTVNLIR